jgi:hypothetical protein
MDEAYGMQAVDSAKSKRHLGRQVTTATGAIDATAAF